MDSGRKHRLKRIFQSSARALVVPLDHGVSNGPILGLESTKNIARWASHPAISALIAHKGIMERLLNLGVINISAGLILQLNGMSGLADKPYHKKLLTECDLAVKMGCDAVSIDLNFDGICDADNLILLGCVVDQAHSRGLPVLLMLTDRNSKDDVVLALERMRRLIRLAIEMGVDIVKINYQLPFAVMSELLLHLNDDIKILIAGGEKIPDEAFTDFAKIILNSGASGFCVGRNIFQHPDPIAKLNQLGQLLQHPKI